MNKVEKALQERFLLQEEYLGDEKPINGITPLVSVTVATYQQVSYIKECLDGILMQQTTFPYEIILGEDGSIDGTQEICKEYAERYPDKIRLFIRDRKLSQYEKDDGSITRFNGLWNRMSVRGRYIAWCEGDDYWTDPLKLQKQVDFLEAHEDYGLVHTAAKVYLQEYGKYKENLIGEKFINIDSLLMENHVVTLTTCFRIDIYKRYLQEIQIDPSWKMGDYPLWLFISIHSKAHFMNEVTGVYRILKESASRSKSFQNSIDFQMSTYSIKKYFVKKYQKEYLIKSVCTYTIYSLMRIYILFDKKVDIMKLCKMFEYKSITPKIFIVFVFSRVGIGKKYLQRKWIKIDG